MFGNGSDLWRSSGPSPPAKSDSPKTGCTGSHPGGFQIAPEKELLQPLACNLLAAL